MRAHLLALVQTFFPLVLIFVLPRFLEYFGLKIMNGGGYRPRSSIARIIINKINSDEAVRELAEDVWYRVNLPTIQEERIRQSFVQLSADDKTRQFIDSSTEKSDWIFTQIYHNIAKLFLSSFYSQTDINGILQRGSMFVLSREQFKLMTNGFSGENMVDLGAGDGAPTLNMAESFECVYATEASGPMRNLLKSRNIKILEIDSWTEAGPFDLISCLNLLDRADNPLSILASIKSALKPRGLLLVGLVLPFKPYVEYTPSHRPSEVLSITGKEVENQLESAVAALESAGFTLTAWSKVPYLCEGDLNKSVYHLEDFIMIFKHANNLE